MHRQIFNGLILVFCLLGIYSAAFAQVVRPCQYPSDGHCSHWACSPNPQSKKFTTEAAYFAWVKANPDQPHEVVSYSASTIWILYDNGPCSCDVPVYTDAAGECIQAQ